MVSSYNLVLTIFNLSMATGCSGNVCISYLSYFLAFFFLPQIEIFALLKG